MNPTREQIESLRVARDKWGWSSVTMPLPPAMVLTLTHSVGATLEPLCHPEIAIVGLPHPVAHKMLGRIFERVADGCRFAVGDESTDVTHHKDTGQPLRVVFRPVRDSYKREMYVAHDFAPEGFEVIQAVYADPENVLPDEDGYDVRYPQFLLD